MLVGKLVTIKQYLFFSFAMSKDLNISTMSCKAGGNSITSTLRHKLPRDKVLKIFHSQQLTSQNHQWLYISKLNQGGPTHALSPLTMSELTGIWFHQEFLQPSNN